jgi:hypothetical protein
MTSPLLGVHGRHKINAALSGTVAHIEPGTPSDYADVYLLLDTPTDDGEVFASFPLPSFLPTNPEALRQRLTPRDPVDEARAVGDALGARLLDGSRAHHLVGDAARALVHAALGDSPQSRLKEALAGIGSAAVCTALGDSAVSRGVKLHDLAMALGRAVRS